MIKKFKLIECPRDAMQGLHDFIPTEIKTRYINKLLTLGYDTLDFGSFVSPKAIPQLRDTAEVLSNLNLTDTNLLAIVANQRGAIDACNFEEIKYLGFPFSISETFQQRNTKSSIAESLTRVDDIQALCEKHNKELVVYISMAFGNPYGDPWDIGIVEEWTETLAQHGIKILALSDTIGSSNPQNIDYLFSNLIPKYPGIEFGAHLHSTPDTRVEKIEATINAGCLRIDSAIKGFGGCPMAKDDLTGNMATEIVLDVLNKRKIAHGINEKAFAQAMLEVGTVFPQ
jgi:hydroxymethylglutaryl-CoA lyase